nr:AsmA-like C-terminal region-containing protein [uncultured Flavobacterium sp.]
MIKKILKILGISILTLVALLLLLVTAVPYFFKDQITESVEKLANENLNAKVEFSELGVSVFKFFPALIVYAKDVDIKNTNFPQAQNVVTASTAAVGVNFFGLLQGKIVLDAIYLDKGNLNLEIDSLGVSNFNIVKPSETSSDTTATEFKIKKIIVNKTNISYNDKSTPLNFKISELDYQGFGDLSADLFDLNSKIKMKSFDFSADHVDYVRNKPINAEIVTNIDAKELKFRFERNNIRIKNFPFSFNGHFAFIKGGYDFDLRMQSKNSTLEEMLSLVPPAYDEWREAMNITGNIDFKILARGKYLQDQSEKPIVLADLKINSGSLAYKKIKQPVQNINIDAKALVKDLDINKLKFDLQNLSFDLDGDATKINFHSEGFTKLKLKSEILSNIDLAKFKDALNLNQHDLRGKINLDLKADGYFERGLGFNAYKNKQDTIIKSIPKFTLAASLKNGYLKNIKKKEAIKNVNLDLNLVAKDSILRNLKGKITNINVEALENYIRGDFELHSLYPFNIDTELESRFNLSEIHKLYPLDSMEVKGDLNLKVSAHGVLNSKTKKYPASNTFVKITNGYLKSLKYPNIPIENINLSTQIISAKGTAEDLILKLNPVQLELAGSPFKIEGEVKNLRDIVYDIKTQGTLDIGQLTKIFPVKDMEISGLIQTNLIAKGSKKDLDAKDYTNIKNGGKLVAQNIVVSSKLFPEAFKVSSGTFKFFKDKMRFEEFYATYGKSDLNLNGYIHNFLRYMFNRKYLRDKKEKLNAEIDLKSNHIDADEFMTMLTTYSAASEDKKATVKVDTTQKAPQAVPNRGPSVFRISRTANLKITANVKEIEFEEYKMQTFTGELLVKDRNISISNASFQMAGTSIAMTGIYEPKHRLLANYKANFKAQNFDIQRAYAEIPIFNQMVSMAKDAYGIASLDYTLAGAIDQNMDIDFKAIEGEGTLTLEDIQFKNFKILEHVAKKADAQDLDKANFNQIAIHTTIKNNVMTITPVTMKMAGFRGKLEGQVSMDGKINIGFRLGLPPMGLINVPMKITGTADNFEVSTGKYKEDTTFAEESELKNIKAPITRREQRRLDSINNITNNNKILDSIQKS